MTRLDLVIFGATGFTGKHAVIHMVKFAKKYDIPSWGVAGRSETKLDAFMKEVTAKTGEDLSNVKVIVADVGDEKSLQEMCAQTKVLVNCCGQYRLYGEPVVKAAVDNMTHYVDVSGEPQFMELMQLRYNAAAREAGVWVVSACGWDSIPADLGVTFLQQHFTGTLNSVEEYRSLYLPPEIKERGLVKYSNWESLIYGLANHNELSHLRKQLYPQPLQHFKPKLERQKLKKRGSEWFFLFPGADESVVYRTQRYFYEKEQQRPIQFKAYFKGDSLALSITTIFAALLLFMMTQTSFTRNILLKYPRLCSFGVVTKEDPTDNAKLNSFLTNFFLNVELVGKGWEEKADVENTEPNKILEVKVSCLNPGYDATVVAALMSAITILRESEKMPGTGGVTTPGAGFKNTSLIEKLIENDFKFEIVKV